MSTAIPFRLLYETALICYGLIQLPKLFYQAIKEPARRRILARRFGFQFPTVEGEGFRVWVHAVSVGEVRAVASLVERLRAAHPDLHLLLSTGTATGLAEAQRLFPGVATTTILPFDLSLSVRRLVRRFRPKLLIVTETDFWFNFLDEAKRQGASIVVVNGKISERSTRRHLKFPSYCRRLLAPIDRFCLQDEIYLDRFLSLGVEEERLVVTGNIKLDQKLTPLSEDERAQLIQELKIPGEAPIVVIGSTHDPEERELLEQFKRVWEAVPNLRLILVPRHPERFDEVAQICARVGLPWGRYTKCDQWNGEERILLIDAMGMLCNCYQIAQLALVAGSWTDRVGGHNILEPIHFSVPSLFGPHMLSQPTLERIVLKAGAGEQLALDEVGGRVIALLSDSEEMARRAGQLCKEMGGAADATFEQIDPWR